MFHRLLRCMRVLLGMLLVSVAITAAMIILPILLLLCVTEEP